jgi:hypothetical protein
MEIVCQTDDAAAGVLRILLAAQLLPRRDYEIYPASSSVPPITFILRSAMSGTKLAQIYVLADIVVRASGST